jgi:hypothetical protein
VCTRLVAHALPRVSGRFSGVSLFLGFASAVSCRGLASSWVHRTEILRALRADAAEMRPYLTEEFLDLYDSLCETLYWGDHEGENVHVSVSESGSKDFADWRVWWIKKKADHYLSVTAAALRKRLAAQRRQEAQERYAQAVGVVVPRIGRERSRDVAPSSG